LGRDFFYMPHADWFEIDFENFAKKKEIFVPAIGISYRIRDPSYIPERDFPIIHDLYDDLEISRIFSNIKEDFNFITGLKKNIREICGEENNKYDFNMKLVTVPLEVNETMANFLYTHIRMNEDFYKKNRNIGKLNSPINMVGNFIILWGLKNHKRPTELAFNYNQKGSAEENSRILKGHALEELLKPLSTQMFGI